jgi:hypothetical protein
LFVNASQHAFRWSNARDKQQTTGPGTGRGIELSARFVTGRLQTIVGPP